MSVGLAYIWNRCKLLCASELHGWRCRCVGLLRKSFSEDLIFHFSFFIYFKSTPLSLFLRFKAVPNSLQVRSLEWEKNGICIGFARELHGSWWIFHPNRFRYNFTVKRIREADLSDVSDLFVNHALTAQASDKSYKSVFLFLYKNHYPEMG